MEERPAPLQRLPGQIGGIVGFALFAIALHFAYSYALAFQSKTASPFWFAAPVLLCALLWAPTRWWPALLALTVPIRLLTHGAVPIPLGFNLTAVCIDAGEAVLTATLLRRFLRYPFRFETVRKFGFYCLAVVVLVPAICALPGGWMVYEFRFGSFQRGWEYWFLGSAMAHLIITPVLLYWVLSPPDLHKLSKLQRIEAVLLLVGLAVSLQQAFASSGSDLGFTDPRFYAPIAFLVWAAVRFGVLGASAAIALLTAFAIGAAFAGHFPFLSTTKLAMAADLQRFLLLRAAPIYLVAVLTDASRHAEASLRESERRFRTLADTAPVFIWMTDCKARAVFFNKAWVDFTGLTLQEALGSGWAQRMHPADVEMTKALWQSASAKRDSFEVECRMRRYDDEYRWIFSRGVPRYASTGEYLGYVGSSIDVTDRRLQEQALRRSEERYREVIESQTEFVCRLLPDTTLTFVNEAYCRFVDCSREALLGESFLARVPASICETTRSSVMEALDAAAASGNPCKLEWELPRPNEHALFIHWTCHAIRDSDGRVHEFQAIGHDITDRKRAEEADRMLAHAARLASLGELTAVVSHEINQPLFAILANAEAADLLLQAQAPPIDEVRRILADICKDDLRAGEVIRIVRTLTHKRAPELRPLSINAVVDGVARLVAADAARRRVTLIQDLTGDLPLTLGDAPSLEQVLLNLIMNAMDAMRQTPEAQRRITVRTELGKDGGVVMAVEDRGHGIAPEAMSHLFESFFTTKPEGMGVGLSTARSIVLAHRGRIWPENRAEGGVTFFVALPSAEALKSSEHTATDPLLAAQVRMQPAPSIKVNTAH